MVVAVCSDFFQSQVICLLSNLIFKGRGYWQESRTRSNKQNKTKKNTRASLLALWSVSRLKDGGDLSRNSLPYNYHPRQDKQTQVLGSNIRLCCFLPKQENGEPEA